MFYFFFIPRPKRERERKKKSENKYARGKKGPKKECPILFEREREKREVFRSSSSLSLRLLFSRRIFARLSSLEREKKKKKNDEARGGAGAVFGRKKSPGKQK